MTISTTKIARGYVGHEGLWVPLDVGGGGGGNPLALADILSWSGRGVWLTGLSAQGGAGAWHRVGDRWVHAANGAVRSWAPSDETMAWLRGPDSGQGSNSVLFTHPDLDRVIHVNNTNAKKWAPGDASWTVDPSVPATATAGNVNDVRAVRYAPDGRTFAFPWQGGACIHWAPGEPSWSALPLPGDVVGANIICMVVTSTGRLFMAYTFGYPGTRVVRSDDLGQTWTPVSDVPGGGSPAGMLICSPNDTIYWVAQSGANAVGGAAGGLNRLNPDLTTWTPLGGPSPSIASQTYPDRADRTPWVPFNDGTNTFTYLVPMGLP